eukprot:TRINITY_DN38275_c0_g1_i5.p1 TRINITY_DN38275_c0_g1~~TRINITY_DN38275_c0_g1_i5.p1  ORF type:complete len:552 (-),score=150.90 TRINITY_DN38275_c0_g1_i5:411-1985(-)
MVVASQQCRGVGSGASVRGGLSRIPSRHPVGGGRARGQRSLPHGSQPQIKVGALARVTQSPLHRRPSGIGDLSSVTKNLETDMNRCRQAMLMATVRKKYALDQVNTLQREYRRHQLELKELEIRLHEFDLEATKFEYELEMSFSGVPGEENTSPEFNFGILEVLMETENNFRAFDKMREKMSLFNVTAIDRFTKAWREQEDEWGFGGKLPVVKNTITQLHKQIEDFVKENGSEEELKESFDTLQNQIKEVREKKKLVQEDIDRTVLAAERSKQEELQKQKEAEAKNALEAKRLLEEKIEDNRRKAMELRLRNKTLENSSEKREVDKSKLDSELSNPASYEKAIDKNSLKPTTFRFKRIPTNEACLPSYWNNDTPDEPMDDCNDNYDENNIIEDEDCLINGLEEHNEDDFIRQYEEAYPDETMDDQSEVYGAENDHQSFDDESYYHDHHQDYHLQGFNQEFQGGSAGHPGYDDQEVNMGYSDHEVTSSGLVEVNNYPEASDDQIVEASPPSSQESDQYYNLFGRA